MIPSVPMKAAMPEMPKTPDNPIEALASMDPKDMGLAMSQLDPEMLKTLISVAQEALTGVEQDKGIDEADPASVV